MSAGSKPTGQVHPRSLALLEREGISTEGYYSKSWNDLPVTPDIVLSVCGNAANETCPAYLGPVLRSHWGVEDPAHVTGTDAEIDAAFMTAYRILRHRIETFLALAAGRIAKRPCTPESGTGSYRQPITLSFKRTLMTSIQVFDPHRVAARK